MPVTPITKTANWRYEKMPDGRVFIISPVGEDFMMMYGGTLQTRLDRAALVVRKLNK